MLPHGSPALNAENKAGAKRLVERPVAVHDRRPGGERENLNVAYRTRNTEFRGLMGVYTIQPYPDKDAR